MNYTNKLTVENGRLINRHEEDCMAPITQAAIMRKAMKDERKKELMADAMYRAEMRAEMMDVVKKG